MKFLQLNFVPSSTDAALLVLRLWLGLSMLWLHGLGKLMNFSTMSSQFADPFGLGKTPSLAAAVFAELICAGLLALGLWTRLAAFFAASTMGVAFWYAHGAKLSGAGSGELAWIYLAGFATIFIAGPGRYSVDAKTGAKV